MRGGAAATVSRRRSRGDGLAATVPHESREFRRWRSRPRPSSSFGGGKEQPGGRAARVGRASAARAPGGPPRQLLRGRVPATARPRLPQPAQDRARGLRRCDGDSVPAHGCRAWICEQISLLRCVPALDGAGMVCVCVVLGWRSGFWRVWSSCVSSEM